MLQAIYRLVVIEQVVREPFSSKCLALHLPDIPKDRIALYLTRHSGISTVNRNPFLIRVFRGRYRFNESRLSELRGG